MGREVNRDRALALAVTALVQAAFVLMLARFVPTSRVATADDALIVEYVPRQSYGQAIAAIRAPAVQQKVPSREGQRRQYSRDRKSSGAESAVVDSRSDAEPAPLDLRIPDNSAMTDHFAERERPHDPSIDPRTTRFADAWRGGGTLLDQARARSGIVRIATSLFGGPPRHCSEVDRRLRKPDCLPEPDDLERLEP